MRTLLEGLLLAALAILAMSAESIADILLG